ncbi:hypothetical protein BZA05DRAFT_220478 [Tricharina praecox]|uniref:uncharacterized protein n=1 Tax=Tricharina praecox TaxID=43433 RepID=UPI00222109A9|nr:uncharacterized protein BZA05DRAFT_220478 [Tricharina praecox]KAI5855904.1 hypothetical protein BZA05DRAFT_220478 [Tricharina praecox]
MASRSAFHLQRLQRSSVLWNCRCPPLRYLRQPIPALQRYQSDQGTSAPPPSPPSPPAPPPSPPAPPPPPPPPPTQPPPLPTLKRTPITTRPVKVKGPAQQPPQKFIPPPQCPGCGAPSQQIDRSLPGWYPEKPEKRLRTVETIKAVNEDAVWKEALKRAEGNPNLLEQLGITEEDGSEALENTTSGREGAENGSGTALLPPVCDRCHHLKYNHHGPSLPAYPTLHTLSSLILNSGHEHNHIYHLVDAADFPMSLRTDLRNHLYKTLPKKITRNLTISYLITRCDVLMPQREQITSLMSYFKSVIRDVLPPDEKIEGSVYSGTRLHAISTRVGWDIGELKEEISARRGGVWFAGAVNVGKSSLLRDIWPMSGELRPVSLEDAAEFEILPAEDSSWNLPDPRDVEEGELDRILNQARAHHSGKRAAPHVAPTVSEVPGTTAAPIRVSYKSAGRGGKLQGEVVDLPGFERWVGFKETGLMKYVRPKKHRFLVMRERVKPQQYSIRPGQSLLIGGLIMITPLSPHAVVLVNPFTTLPVHVSATSKCIRFMNNPNPENGIQYRDNMYQDPATTGIRPIDETLAPRSDDEIVSKREDFEMAEDWASDKVAVEPTEGLPTVYKSAGVFTLTDDVTTKRNPMLDDRSPEAVAQLPYKVLATDILLEGLGWVELTAQVRNRQDRGYQTVDVEVFTPEGKGIGQRKTMSAYRILEEGARLQGLQHKTARPRGSMKGKKKMMKKKARA